MAENSFVPSPLYTGPTTPVATEPARDLSAVASHLDVAAWHLRRDELTAGSELILSAMRSYRSLLGEFEVPVAEHLGEMVAGISVGLITPEELAVEANTVALQIRAEIPESPQDGQAVDVKA